MAGQKGPPPSGAEVGPLPGGSGGGAGGAAAGSPGSEWHREDPDRDLVRRLRRHRSPEAFRELYERHKDKVVNTAFHLIGDREEALEAAQEVFLRVHRKVHRFRGRSSFSSWLYRITVNVATDHRRRLGRTRVLLEGYTTSGPPAAERSAGPRGSGAGDERAAQRETAERVRRALLELSPKLAAVLTLRYLEGLAYGEIAEALAVSVGTVKSRLNRAHRALAPLVADLAKE